MILMRHLINYKLLQFSKYCHKRKKKSDYIHKILHLLHSLLFYPCCQIKTFCFMFDDWRVNISYSDPNNYHKSISAFISKSRMANMYITSCILLHNCKLWTCCINCQLPAFVYERLRYKKLYLSHFRVIFGKQWLDFRRQFIWMLLEKL